MTSASHPTPEGAQLGRSFASARREVKKLNDQARKANRAMAKLEEELAALGIKFAIHTITQGEPQ